MSGIDVSVLFSKDYRISAWSGGSTTQLAISPASAVYAKRDFLWRLSSATVEAERSCFTPLPGVQRWLMPLEGTVELHHAGREAVRLEPYEVDAFDGGDDTVSIGRCRDFNLMTRENCEGALAAFLCGPEGTETTLASGGSMTEAFYAVDGKVAALLEGRAYTLPKGGLLLLRINGENGAAKVEFHAARPTHIVRAAIREDE